MSIKNDVAGSIVDYVARNTGHDRSAFSAFEKEFTADLDKAKLESLDGSKESKALAAKVQKYIMQNGGSSIPVSVAGIEAADDKALAAAKNGTSKGPEVNAGSNPKKTIPAPPVTQDNPKHTNVPAAKPANPQNGNGSHEVEPPSYKNGYEGIKGVPNFFDTDEGGAFETYQTHYDGNNPPSSPPTQTTGNSKKSSFTDNDLGSFSGYESIYRS